MSGTPVGGLRSAATRILADPVVYAERIIAGQKWCWLCRDWHPRAAFGLDTHRSDGKNANCREAIGRRAKRQYAARKALAHGV
jgi:hypothetical protein